MDSYAISRVRTRYIVPFEINLEENSFEEICRKIDDYVDEPYSFLGQKCYCKVQQKKIDGLGNL